MTKEPTTTEATQPAPAPPRPETYTHLTVTFREPLAGAQAVTGTLTLEMEAPLYEEDVLDYYPDVVHPVREKGSGDCDDTSDVAIHRDDADDIYAAIDKALTDAGRKSSFSWFQTGDLLLVAYLDAAGEIQTAHSYESDGQVYLVDIDWVTEWRFHNA